MLGRHPQLGFQDSAPKLTFRIAPLVFPLLLRSFSVSLSAGYSFSGLILRQVIAHSVVSRWLHLLLCSGEYRNRNQGKRFILVIN